jgi:hypothetical protein
VCWKLCSSCWSFHLLREEFLSAPIHSPLSGSPYRSFTHLRQNHAQAKSTNHQSKAQTTQRAPPAHMQGPPELKHNPPEPMQQCNMGIQQEAKSCTLCLGPLDRLHWGVRPPTCHLTAWGRLDRPMRPTLHQTFQKLLGPIGTPSKCSQVPKSCTNFSPLLAMHESRQNVKSFNI